MENQENITEEKIRTERPKEIDLIKNQWIPDIEKTIHNVLDADMKKGFEMELAKIKTDFAEIENVDFSDEDVMKKVKNVYERAEDLFGKIALCFEKDEE
jgi:hypothetical protein